MPHKQPEGPLPDPLRGIELGTFTHRSIVERLPKIGRRMLAVNSFPAAVMADLEKLVEGIPEAPIEPLNDDGAADAAEWQRDIAPYLGQDWLQPPWFFVETYFSRRLLAISGYFRNGRGRDVDPFAYDKRRGLEHSKAAIQALSGRVGPLLAEKGRQPETLVNLLFADLWGNQADMSMWPAGEDEAAEARKPQAHTLVDDSAEVAAHLFERLAPAERIDILLDNAGFELVADLHLAVYLLEHDLARTVRLMAKVHPIFVSDALKGDVLQTIDHLAADDDPGVADIGRRLGSLLAGGRLTLTEDWFWNSALPAWQMPLTLRQDLAGADLLISKGDANYRRWLGDRHWPFTTPFGEVVGYTPAPLAVLRTLKAEVMIGLTPEKLHQVSQADPGWLANGSWGVIQYHRPEPAGQ
ncbi:MAG: protein-glutamate O-methyltransferase family protein [Chloroflexota bacterium]|nr:MAG: protein-glutamate O-methyltransferase family protein [Chloroflexota bacterium]